MILLVEDNPDHAELALRTLADRGIGSFMRHVADGEEALDYLFRRGAYADPESSPRPDVVLLDLRLPGIDGLEVLSAIREDAELRRLPVIILTTSEADPDIAGARKRHADGYLVKPVAYEQFCRALGRLPPPRPRRGGPVSL
jgi:two-component system, response regulator